MSSSLRGRAGRDLVRGSRRFSPGQLAARVRIPGASRSEPLGWVLLGWVGTLLVGSQVMKLIMEGIHLIYGDRKRHSFLGRQLRGLLLFCVSIVAWLLAVALSVFGRPLRQWITRELGHLRWLSASGRNASGLGSDSDNARPSLDLSRCATGPDDLEVSSARSGGGCDSVVEHRFSTVWNLRSEDAVWTGLRRASRSDRLDGVDGVLGDGRLSWCSLERRKRCTPQFAQRPRVDLLPKRLASATSADGHHCSRYNHDCALWKT